MGLGLSGKSYRDDPFSPRLAEKGQENAGLKDEPIASDMARGEPLGIEALLSAAESEREREEQRRASEGDGTVLSDAKADSTKTTEVEMEETSQAQQAVAA
jgi:hypothetical protein